MVKRLQLQQRVFGCVPRLLAPGLAARGGYYSCHEFPYIPHVRKFMAGITKQEDNVKSDWLRAEVFSQAEPDVITCVEHLSVQTKEAYGSLKLASH